jgi:hypothetical protein
MSYILNALKKAEHDRKREEPEDLDDFVSAGWDPYQEAPKSGASYKLAVIIVAIAALLFVGFYSLNPGLQQAVEVVEEVVSDQLAEPSVEQQVAPVLEEFVEEAIADEPAEEELQLPEVTIAGHIYIRSGSAKNRIFIGDKTYYVGDSIDGNWVIESINFDSLGIRSGALSSELPLR